MNIRTGWVGFFDILGYANLLQRNEPELIAQYVVPLLIGAKPEVVNKARTFVEYVIGKNSSILKDSPYVADNLRKFIDDLTWLLFSDTILITMPSDESEDGETVLKWIIFLDDVRRVAGQVIQNGAALARGNRFR